MVNSLAANKSIAAKTMMTATTAERFTEALSGVVKRLHNSGAKLEGVSRMRTNVLPVQCAAVGRVRLGDAVVAQEEASCRIGGAPGVGAATHSDEKAPADDLGTCGISGRGLGGEPVDSGVEDQISRQAGRDFDDNRDRPEAGARQVR